MRSVESCAIGIETEPQNAEATQRVASLLPEFRHLLARCEANFDRANQFWDIVSVNSFRSRGVEPTKKPVKMIGATFRSALPQALAQFFGTLRAGKKSFEQRAQIKPGAADHNGQMPRAR